MSKRPRSLVIVVALLAGLTACTSHEPKDVMTSLTDSKTKTHQVVDAAVGLLPVDGRLHETSLTDSDSQCTDDSGGSRQWQYRVDVTFDESVDVRTTALKLVTDLGKQSWTIRRDLSNDSEASLLLSRSSTATNPVDNLQVTSSPRSSTAPGSIAIGTAGPCVDPE